MRRALSAGIIVCALSGLARAEDLNLSARPETTTVGLSPYALGLGVGVVMPVSEELLDENPAFLRLSLAQSLRFHQNIDMGMDLDWWLPGMNLGGAVHISYVLGKGAFRPFIGAGVGLQYVGMDGEKFGNNFGAQGLAHVGMFFDVLDELQMRLRVPFQMVANERFDQVAGLDIALLFSSPQRKTRVRKLTYP